MSIKQIIVNFLIVSALTFVVASAVSYLYSLVLHSNGVVDWGSAIRLGIILGFVITWVESKNKKQ